MSAEPRPQSERRYRTTVGHEFARQEFSAVLRAKSNVWRCTAHIADLMLTVPVAHDPGAFAPGARFIFIDFGWDTHVG